MKKTRQQLSNPYHGLSQEELQKLAGVEKIDDSYEVVRLKNGLIAVVKKDQL